MKKLILTIITCIGFFVIALTQTKKVAIVIANDVGEYGGENYDQIVRDYIIENLKKISNITISDLSETLTKKAKQEIETTRGDFLDTSFVNKVVTKGIEYLVVVYYAGDTYKQQTTSGSTMKITYAAQVTLKIQMVNTKTNQILDSKSYSSGGISIQSPYKTREESVKETLKTITRLSFEDRTKIVDYFKETFGIK